MRARPWADWRWVASIAAALAAAALLSFSLSVPEQSNKIDELGVILEKLDGLAAANAENLEGIQKQGRGVQALVDYVDELRARPAGPTAASLLEILCASSDPVRVAACADVAGRP